MMPRAVKLTMTAIMLWLFYLAGTARCLPRRESPCNENVQLPGSVQAAIKTETGIRVSCRLKPVLIQGDFDGDGRPDYAVLVINEESRKRGFLIVFGNGARALAGAGRPIMYGAIASPDLNFDHWELFDKSRPVQSAENQEILKLRGDGLLVSYHESGSGIFYWDGKRLRWYQQGD